jgi:hypothetical protein
MIDGVTKTLAKDAIELWIEVDSHIDHGDTFDDLNVARAADTVVAAILTGSLLIADAIKRKAIR